VLQSINESVRFLDLLPRWHGGYQKCFVCCGQKWRFPAIVLLAGFAGGVDLLFRISLFG